MSSFLEQPTSFRIGSAIIDELEDGRWARVSMAVAWVRRSGTNLLLPSLTTFLRAGGTVRIVAGLDFGQTTYEALHDLIMLAQHGAIEVFVFHDESGSVFHPKVYCFEDNHSARLLTGSSNITQGGLYTNVEALIAVSGPLDTGSIREARLVIDSWADTLSPHVLRVDNAVLESLRANGYVVDEATARRLTSGDLEGPRSLASGERLFGSSSGRAPAVPRRVRTVSSPSTAVQGSAGQVLLVRVRTARGTQVQVPFRLWEDPFFNHVAAVISGHDGQTRQISTARAHGRRNTAKLEIPETSSVVVPVVRFEHTSDGLEYRVYDGTFGIGAIMLGQLQGGLRTTPRVTEQSIADLSRATLWRFI